MAEQDEGFSTFLSGLLKAITSGAQSSKDAFFEDVDKVKEHRLPPQAMKAGAQVLGSMGNPSIAPTIPALTHVRKVFDPATGWSEVAKTYPGGNWLEMFTRQGGLGPFLETLLKGMEKPRP
jgi:hypothetical protein